MVDLLAVLPSTMLVADLNGASSLLSREGAGHSLRRRLAAQAQDDPPQCRP